MNLPRKLKVGGDDRQTHSGHLTWSAADIQTDI